MCCPLTCRADAKTACTKASLHSESGSLPPILWMVERAIPNERQCLIFVAVLAIEFPLSWSQESPILHHGQCTIAML
jgi:hypothetical protein